MNLLFLKSGLNDIENNLIFYGVFIFSNGLYFTSSIKSSFGNDKEVTNNSLSDDIGVLKVEPPPPENWLPEAAANTDISDQKIVTTLSQLPLELDITDKGKEF